MIFYDFYDDKKITIVKRKIQINLIISTFYSFSQIYARKTINYRLIRISKNIIPYYILSRIAVIINYLTLRYAFLTY